MLARTFSEQFWFSCCYVVAVVVDDVNVVVHVIFGFIVVALVRGVGIVGDVADIVQ